MSFSRDQELDFTREQELEEKPEGYKGGVSAPSRLQRVSDGVKQVKMKVDEKASVAKIKAAGFFSASSENNAALLDTQTKQEASLPEPAKNSASPRAAFGFVRRMSQEALRKSQGAIDTITSSPRKSTQLTG